MLSRLKNEQIDYIRWSNNLFGHGVSPIRDWYGIPNIKYIYLNDWSDPLIEYKGKRFSSYIVEDTMWERWIYDDDGVFMPQRENDDEGFARFMRDNSDEVYELCEEIIESEVKNG